MKTALSTSSGKQTARKKRGKEGQGNMATQYLRQHTELETRWSKINERNITKIFFEPIPFKDLKKLKYSSTYKKCVHVCVWRRGIYK